MLSGSPGRGRRLTAGTGVTPRGAAAARPPPARHGGGAAARRPPRQLRGDRRAAAVPELGSCRARASERGSVAAEAAGAQARPLRPGPAPARAPAGTCAAGRCVGERLGWRAAELGPGCGALGGRRFSGRLPAHGLRGEEAAPRRPRPLQYGPRGCFY